MARHMVAFLAAPSATPFVRGGEMVRFGTLGVPRAASADFAAAASYLCRDPMMRDIIERAEHEVPGLQLRVNARGDDSYEWRTHCVNWDPHSALRTTDGGTQSPALGLGHELDHATAAARLRARGTATSDACYDNAEERRVICGSEAHAARTLGEGVRHDHAGSVYDVDSPIAR